jgi:hypothetical protein
MFKKGGGGKLKKLGVLFLTCDPFNVSTFCETGSKLSKACVCLPLPPLSSFASIDCSHFGLVFLFAARPLKASCIADNTNPRISLKVSSFYNAAHEVLVSRMQYAFFPTISGAQVRVSDPAGSGLHSYRRVLLSSGTLLPVFEMG